MWSRQCSRSNTASKQIKVEDTQQKPPSGRQVVVKEENMPPGKWALARVQEVHPGSDGHIRVVTVKTQNSIMKRPISKLVLLPVHENEQQPANNSEQRPARQFRPRKVNYKNLFIILMTIMLIIPSSLQEPYKITQLKNNNSLYFDKTAEMQIIKDQWTMVVYYNLTTYWQSMNHLEKFVKNLGHSCNKSDICSTIISQYEHELKEIGHFNDLLTANNHHRSAKRGLINVIGNVANALFGVLDDKFADQYKQDIDNIQENESHLLSLLKNQTSIIEAQNNILHRNEQHMNNQFEIINNALISISKETNFIRQSFFILSNAASIGIMISNVRRVQESLINTVTDIFQGRLDIHILSPEQLQEQLNIISGQISSELSVPVKPENIEHIYDILHVRAKVKCNYLLIEIKVPLTTNDVYELDSVITLPQTINRDTWYAIPVADHIAFNVRKDTFIPMLQSDILSCTRYHKTRLLCGLTAPIYELKVGKSICDIKISTQNSNQTFCKINSMPCTDSWIKLHATDAWLYSCCDECHVRIMCPTSLTSLSLSGSGIILIDQDCAVKGDSFTLLGHHDYKSQIMTQPSIQDIRIPIISTLNKLINTSIPMHLMKTDNEDSVNRIQKQIHLLKEASIKDVTRHDVHHYVMIYVLLGITALVITGLTCVFVQVRRWQPRTELPTARATAAGAASANSHTRAIYATPASRPPVLFAPLPIID